ncbi:2-isopropylmalate synthase [Colletotrichum truncatum]|uniref:2-isopropylmalate synthase n=1 Tax=Colletotrichum truncatum TaxID=5467 RepID=A0ACC3ZC36_COLTU|nr:2-isopropylmalate synthase [Colletotrichum truncatum]KAF6783813.1 2-isopropylmalate synthase [Colletotrichum truncatum]
MLDALTIRDKYGGRLPPAVPLKDRQWPGRSMTKCPQFLSHDLRDGNQASPIPMTFNQKVVMFKQIVSMGFKEIELAYTGASQADHDFVRYVIETPSLVPDDVCVQVCAPCRKDALLQAVKSLHGAKKANVFTYIGCSDYLREVVLRMTEDEWVERARSCAAYVRSLVKDGGPYAEGTEWTFSFGFEDFSNARVEPVVRCAEAVKSAWKPTVDDKMVLGVAASVEISPPNIFADRVEYLLKQLTNRETFRFGVHPHNDRGCAVAAAELACLAGADRVDGCLFGHGERGGNVDMIIVAANAMTMGLDPGLDMNRLDEVAKTFADITGIPVHPRTPYSGDFYFRAFSGLHQDAILKGLRARKNAAANEVWRVPYLPLDPSDLNRDMQDCVVGITSQSGKSGIAWILGQYFGLNQIPVEVLRSFQSVVQKLTERAEEERHSISNYDICQAFCKVYHIEMPGQNVQPAFLVGTNSSEVLRLDDILSNCNTSDTAETCAVLASVLKLPKQIEISVQHENLDESPNQLLPGSVGAYAKLTDANGAVEWGVGIGGGKTEALIRAVISAAIAHGHLRLWEPEARESKMSGRHIGHLPAAPRLHGMKAVETI